VFNCNTPISTYSHLRLLPIIWSCNYGADRQHSTQAETKIVPQVCLSLSPFCRLPPWCELCLTVLSDSQVYCCLWAVLSAKFSVAVPSAIQLCISHFKVQMASSCHNSSTSVLLLGTFFNTILCFSNQMAYPPNVPWHSRWIHQRGHSSPRSPSSTI